MIFLPSQGKVPGEYISNFEKDYTEMLAFLTDDQKKSFGHRDWEYATALYYSELAQDDVVLDIGGGFSGFSLYVASMVQEVYVIDNGSSMPELFAVWQDSLKEFPLYKEGKVKLISQNASVCPFPDSFFNKVFTFSALEHFMGEDDSLTTKEIYRVLKDDGYFLGTVDFNPCSEHPHPTSPDYRAYTYESFFRRIINPANFKLFGEAQYLDPIPTHTDYIAAPLFFSLRRKVTINAEGFSAKP